MKNQFQIVLTGLVKITKEELLADDARNYNPREWEKMVNRFESYGAEFYKVKGSKESGYSYDRFYAVYNIFPEGLKFFNDIGYSSSLTSNGFAKVIIDETAGTVTRELFDFKEKGFSYCGNTKENRIEMSKMTKAFGTIFSNCI